MNEHVPDSSRLPLRAMVMVLLFLGTIFLLVGFQALGSSGTDDETSHSPTSKPMTTSSATAKPEHLAHKSDVRVYNISEQAGLAGHTFLDLGEPMTTGMGLLLGVLGLLGAIAALFGRFQWVQAALAVAALLAALILKQLYWMLIDDARSTHSIEDATGLGRIGKVAQWELAHTSENYIQREMGYAVARKHADKLRLVVK